MIIAGVLRRPCCAANFAGGKSGVLELDRAVTRAWISDDDGVIAVAEHGQVAARVDESAAATGGTQRDERAVDCITFGDAAEIDVQRDMRDHEIRRYKLQIRQAPRRAG